MYCFFDIDGVLNKTSQWKIPYSLDDNAVELFCKLIKENGLVPILTSSWRIGFEESFSEKNTPQVRELERKLKKNNVIIEGKTPILKGRSRNIEIERYLYYHPCKRYIILDDDKEEFTEITQHNYFTNSNNGITENDVKNIKRILRSVYEQ